MLLVYSTHYYTINITHILSFRGDQVIEKDCKGKWMRDQAMHQPFVLESDNNIQWASIGNVSKIQVIFQPHYKPSQ
jgi:hypothetical protein